MILNKQMSKTGQWCVSPEIMTRSLEIIHTKTNIPFQAKILLMFISYLLPVTERYIFPSARWYQELMELTVFSSKGCAQCALSTNLYKERSVYSKTWHISVYVTLQHPAPISRCVMEQRLHRLEPEPELFCPTSKQSSNFTVGPHKNRPILSAPHILACAQWTWDHNLKLYFRFFIQHCKFVWDVRAEEKEKLWWILLQLFIHNVKQTAFYMALF